MRRVVSDTGPILHLSEAQALSLLRRTGEVHIPISVDTEIPHFQPDWQTQRPDWITVDGLVAPHDEEATGWQRAGLLDAGEAEAIALARQMTADWMLTDDTAARLFAHALGLEVHGSPGVVLWSAATGYLDRAEAEATLDRLAQSSLWVSAQVLAEARAALDQLCGP